MEGANWFGWNDLFSSLFPDNCWCPCYQISMILSRFRWQPHGVKSLLPIEFAPEVVLELKLLKILLKCSGLLFACYMYIWNRVQLTSSDFPSLELWRSELHQTRSQLYCSQSSRRKVVKMINLKQRHLCEICALLCPIEGMTQGPEDRPAFYLFTWGKEHCLKTIFISHSSLVNDVLDHLTIVYCYPRNFLHVAEGKIWLSFIIHHHIISYH